MRVKATWSSRMGDGGEVIVMAWLSVVSCRSVGVRECRPGECLISHESSYCAFNVSFLLFPIYSYQWE